jgi:peptidase C26-like protein
VLGTSVRVPSAHHQAPNRLGDGLVVAGWSPDDDVTEAVEVAGHRFGVGVHWHPEEGDDPRLLAALIEAAAQAPEPSGGSGAPEPRREPVAAKKVAVKPKAGVRSRLSSGP